ncbi:MAG: NAD(P)-dependent oxidoreductase [Deltaproteobacteria bacterium]|nr:NAD(P)-dependent oxidoreductase [Deltaproteobacteria bacterium]
MPILTDRFEAKILLTGASGFVGGRLRDALLDVGADVVAIRRKSSPEPKAKSTRAARSVVAEYDDTQALADLVAQEKPDYVFHVAGATKGVSYEDFQRANVMPTRNLLRAVRDQHPELQRFVLVSSLAAFGPSTATRPHEESSAPAPIEHYGRSKLEAEEVLAQESAGVAWTTVRPSGVYGPGDVDYFNLFREVERGRNVYFGNRQRWFSAVYVDDCVRAIVDAARSPRARGESYFLCDGTPITWETFQEAIVRASGKEVMTLDLPELLVDLAAIGGELMTKFDGKPRLFNRQKATMGAQEAWTCRHTKAREHFGYTPTVALAEGVRRTLDWYHSERWLP